MNIGVAAEYGNGIVGKSTTNKAEKSQIGFRQLSTFFNLGNNAFISGINNFLDAILEIIIIDDRWK